MKNMVVTVPTVEVKREFNAPIEKVFDAFADIEQMKQWFKPKTETMAFPIFDFKVGGAFRFEFKSINSDAMHIAVGEYLEIDEPNKISFTWQWEGHADEDHRKPSQVDISFDEKGGKTTVKLIHRLLPTEAIRESHRQGWYNCLEPLTAYLS